MFPVLAHNTMQRDRVVVLAGLLGIAVLAWVYLGWDAARMASMSMPDATAAEIWSPGWLLPTFIMWAVMMVGMMLPSAAPAIVLYGAIVRKNRVRGSTLPSVWLFTAGYLAAWTAFSLLVTILQAALQTAALVTPMMVSSSDWLNGGLLMMAGVYQWLPAKDACLEKCRDPLQMFLFRWRPGSSGAFRMGFEHGVFCTGCCWALMLVLFATGIMNLLLVALIAGYVLAEKLVPAGKWTGRVAGTGLAILGVAMMI